MADAQDSITVERIQAELRSLANADLAAGAVRFFKTGPGQYGEGDVFLGVRAADLHRLSRASKSLPLAEASRLLQSPIHEERSLALLILVRAAARASDDFRRKVYELYLANTAFVNNWDLVDCSAPPLVGAYLEDKSRRPLYRLARSKSLWERRIAIVATQHFIRHGDFADTLKIAALLLGDREDLIHKATGWMLREVGKRDTEPLEEFLHEHGRAMPRTMLRYAIERFPPEKRQAYLRGTR